MAGVPRPSRTRANSAVTPGACHVAADAGPTGFTAACELARRGATVRIIDRAPEPSRATRALGVQPRTVTQVSTAPEVRTHRPKWNGSVTGDDLHRRHNRFGLRRRSLLVTATSRVQRQHRSVGCRQSGLGMRALACPTAVDVGFAAWRPTNRAGPLGLDQ
jgi:FAD binding domain